MAVQPAPSDEQIERLRSEVDRLKPLALASEWHQRQYRKARRAYKQAIRRADHEQL